ncbi:MAG: hypothetical protein ACLQFR_06765 [Streptosporangiaceae bacterium]
MHASRICDPAGEVQVIAILARSRAPAMPADVTGRIVAALAAEAADRGSHRAETHRQLPLWRV